MDFYLIFLLWQLFVLKKFDILEDTLKNKDEPKPSTHSKTHSAILIDPNNINPKKNVWVQNLFSACCLICFATFSARATSLYEALCHDVRMCVCM